MSTLGFKKMNSPILGTILFFSFFYASYSLIGILPVKTEISFYFERYKQALMQIDHFSKTKEKSIVAFGPSDIALNFSPNQIQKLLDKKVQSVEILNYGVILAGPDLMKNLVSTLHERLKIEKDFKKIDLAILRFEPMMYTNTYSKFMSVVGARFQKNLEAFQDDKVEISQTFLDKLEAAQTQGTGSLYFKKVLIQNLNSNQDFLLKNGVKPDFRNKYNYIWDVLAKIKLGKEWEQDVDGEINIFSDAFKEENINDFLQKNKLEVYYGGFESHKIMYNHVGLDFSDKYFQDLNESINMLNAISKKVVVLYIPNLFLNEFEARTSLAQARLQAKLGELRSDTRIELWDYTEKWKPSLEEVFDLNHFTEVGKSKFNQLMAEDIYNAIK